MKLRSLVVGLVGGIIGTVLVLALVLALDINVFTQNHTVVQMANGTTVSYPSSSAGLTPAQIYTQSVPSVVEVISTFKGVSTPFGPSGGGQGLGTGFVVSKDGYILTNQHVVVDQQTQQTASSVTVGLRTPDGQIHRIKATVVGADATTDVALLKIDPAGLNLQPLPIGNSDKVQVGEPVVAIGNPLNFDFTITSGIVSAVHRTLDSPNGRPIPNGIQTDAAINPGNSGGPLIDSTGAVIGINEQIASQSGGNVGLGFAVPINAAMQSMSQLKQFGKVTYSWLGISGQTITADLATAYKLPVTQGVLIAKTLAGQPAEKAGIQGGTRTVTFAGQTYTLGGDIITAVDGKAVATIDDLISTVSVMKPGTQVTLTVLRGGKTLQVQVKLVARPANQ
jgi:S1-C subfamily serine protease